MHILSFVDMHHNWSINHEDIYYTRIPDTSYFCHVCVPNMTLSHVWKYPSSVFFKNTDCINGISVSVIAQTISLY